MIIQEDFSLGMSIKTMSRVIRRPEMRMLLPIVFFSGMELGYVMSEFTRDFIRPSVGEFPLSKFEMIFVDFVLYFIFWFCRSSPHWHRFGCVWFG
jgi:hypothetical protein